jgi:hypothetical protein
MTVLPKVSDGRAHDGILLTIEQPGLRPIPARLGLGCHKIGKAVDNDIVLFDEGLDDLHFELETGRPVRLRALGGTVFCADGMELSSGAVRIIDESHVHFSAGNTSFRIDLPEAAPAPPHRSSWLKSSLLGVAGVVAVMSVLAAISILKAVAVSRPFVPLVSAVAERPPAPNAAQVLPEMIARLNENQIETIDLKVLADGSVRAGGHIAPAQEAAWRQIEHWFDGAYGGRVVLVNQVDKKGGTAPLTVQAVRPGVDGYVIDGEGNKLFIGAIVKDGWRLVSIGSDQLVLRRVSQTLSLRF